MPRLHPRPAWNGSFRLPFGKMHDDLKKSAKDDTLEASLFAMKNSD